MTITEAPTDAVQLDARLGVPGRRRRRWLVAIDPVFEGGRWGKRAQAWDVEDRLVAVAIFGDVTIDLSQTRSAPAEIDIVAHTLLRDVDVLVAAGTAVEMDGTRRFGGHLFGDLKNEVPDAPQESRSGVVRIHGHTMLGDVTVRLADGHRRAERHDLPGAWVWLTQRWNAAIANRRIGSQGR